MMRRLLGPVGGPILFILVAVAVFGVLGWVTHSALRVEQAQREAAARAELGSNLRVALWRMDGRMLPALGVEYSRPYYQYGPADPENGYGLAASPLLTTTLPDWIKLHFQLDGVTGWNSPQVLCKEIVDRVQDAWGLSLQNVNGDREIVLKELRKNYPFQPLLNELTAREGIKSGDATSVTVTPPSGEVAASQPMVAPPPTQPTVDPKINPSTTNPDTLTKQTTGNTVAQTVAKQKTYRLFGIEICVCTDPTANNLALNPLRNESNDVQKKNDGMNQSLPLPHPAQGTSNSITIGRNGRVPQNKDENYQGRADTSNREAETKVRGINDVQPQANIQPRGQGNYNSNLFNNSQSQMANDLKLTGNTTQQAAGANPTSPNPGSSANPTNPIGPGGKVQGNPAPGQSPIPNSAPSLGSPKDDNAKDLTKFKQPADSDGKGLMGGLAEAAIRAKIESDRNEKRALDKLKDDFKKTNGELPFFHRLMYHPGICFEPVKEMVERSTVPSGGAPGAPPMGNANLIGNAVFPPPQTNGNSIPLVNYLGSMRPQWVTGQDGSEMLLIVRVATVDNKEICQGIVLDWSRLQSILKDEVNDLFPDAKLIPVKEGMDISTDRVMTSLPFQLDPGPQAELPPAGLTTLRLGLLLAWAAAIIAFGAVGFCGWTLIDLAERRIRFVSAVTHELRTPLTSLRLYLDLLVSGMIQDEAKKQEYLNTLTLESDRLHRLIDNVLDFARLEKRRQNGDFKPAKLDEVIEQLRQTWSDRLAQEGRELVALSTLPVGREITTDIAMVQQIVGNLIDNSRKYSRDASDRRIWVWAKPNGNKSVVIEVEDRGPGVPAGERRSIFKPFRRGEQADKTSGGAGLGLALAKSWAEVLGGRLSYRQADGGTGACFRLELPVS